MSSARRGDSPEGAAGRGGHGCLFVVATPIGNLADLSLRASGVLRSVSLVVAEDTRRTRKLLAHLGVRVPLASCHEHNEASRVGMVLELLQEGRDVALVSDAGTPGLSDPGARLVKEVDRHGLRVVPVPGPSAVTAALSASGMPGGSFFFQGFLPSRGPERRRTLEGLRSMMCTLVFFEAPHRVLAALSDMLDVLGDREMLLARELTKVHEELLRGKVSGVLRDLRARGVPKGEITMVVRGAGEGGPSCEVPGMEERVARALAFLTRDACPGLSTRDLADILAALTGLPRKRLYNMVLKERG